jgi:hypothetical protein
MCKAIRLDAWVSFGAAFRDEPNSAAWSLSNFDDAAPVRCKLEHIWDVLFGTNDSQLFKELLVQRQLLRQADQRIGGAFDFEAVYTAIDDGHIDADLGVRQTEFVYDKRILAPMEGAQRLSMQSGTDFGIGGNGHGASGRFDVGQPFETT